MKHNKISDSFVYDTRLIVDEIVDEVEGVEFEKKDIPFLFKRLLDLNLELKIEKDTESYSMHISKGNLIISMLEIDKNGKKYRVLGIAY